MINIHVCVGESDKEFLWTFLKNFFLVVTFADFVVDSQKVPIRSAFHSATHQSISTSVNMDVLWLRLRKEGCVFGFHLNRRASAWYTTPPFSYFTGVP